jgi:hypothetical protein
MTSDTRRHRVRPLHIATVDERLAVGSWRLASLVNRALDRRAP